MAAGEFSSAERHEIDRCIRAAEQASRYEFSVYVGRAEGEPADFARRLHASLVAPPRSILILVDPVARVIEVVTGVEVRRNLTDREVELIALQMQASFADGHLVDGLRRGIQLLAEHARAPHTLHAE